MRGRAAITRLVLISAALGLAAPAAMGDKRILLAGDAGAVWLACWNPDGGSWSLSVRPAGAPDWEDPREVQARELKELKGLGAAGDGAVLVLEDRKDRAVVRHFPAQSTGHVGVKPGPNLWPLLAFAAAMAPHPVLTTSTSCLMSSLIMAICA